MGGPEEGGATAGDLPDWLQGIQDRFGVIGKVIWCRHDRDDPPSVECVIEMWVRPDRRDAFERILRAPHPPDALMVSRFAEDGLIAVFSTPRPASCPKTAVPWAPCDATRCPLGSRPIGPTYSLPSSHQDQGPGLGRRLVPAGHKETIPAAGQSETRPRARDRHFHGKQPDLRVMHRILKALHDAGGSCPPTRLQLESRTNYTQLERYLEFMATLGLVTVGDDTATRRRLVSLALNGQALFDPAEPPSEASDPHRSYQVWGDHSVGGNPPTPVGIDRVLEALLPKLRGRYESALHADPNRDHRVGDTSKGPSAC
jgi:predicted transcriptional regulator